MRNRIENDKYYTPPELAKQCIEKAFSKIGRDHITRTIEPSAGDGSFSHQLNGCIAIDIDPGADDIIQADFLKTSLKYIPGTLVIGNPPFGDFLSKAQRFFKKSTEIADYIAFILPISQLNNTSSMYQFDLIDSTDLGVHTYTERPLHCCFNIYQRPANGVNKKRMSRLHDITIIREDQPGFEAAEYDLRMCYWGDATAGKILKPSEQYAAVYKIIINNRQLHNEIMDALTSADWKERLNCIAARKIQKFHIVELLKEKVPEIK
ncbi:hypothetical protein [Eisenbergiella sp.]